MSVNQQRLDFMADQFDYTDDFKKIVITILKNNSFDLLKISQASFKKDTEEATDFIVEVKGGNIAVRSRDYDRYRKWDDVTIRVKSKHNKKTEIDKIKEGYVRWYLYMWTKNYKIGDEQFKIIDYVLYDVEKALRYNLFENRRVQKNRDGTAFIGVPLKELKEYGCVLKTEYYQIKQRLL